MGLLRKKYGKKETEASKFAKANKPKAVVTKSPVKLSTVPKFGATGLPLFDGVMGPAVNITASVASMNNALVQLQENIKAFGAMTEGLPTFTQADAMEAGMPTFQITSSKGAAIITIGADSGIGVKDKKEWEKLKKEIKSAKKKVGIEALAKNLGEYLKYLASVIDGHGKRADARATVKIDDDQPFPQFGGEASPRAPWTMRTIETKVSSCLGFCSSTVLQDIYLDELLRRKKASTASGRKGMKKNAAETLKNLKKAEETAKKLMKDQKQLRKAFDEGDTDKSGSLNFDELKALLLKLEIEKDDTEIEEMLNAADKDGSGQVDFNEFVAVQKSIADQKAAEQKTWFDDPAKSQIRENGCLDVDRKELGGGGTLNWTDRSGKKYKGNEKKLLKDCVDEQKEADAAAKDWAQVVYDARDATNIIMLNIRASLIDSAPTELSAATVFSKMYALLGDFAKEMGVKSKGHPSIKTQSDFKLLFKGKNPITGFSLVTADGKEVDFKTKKVGKAGAMQFIYDTFFNFNHPQCFINIFKTLATKAVSVMAMCPKLARGIFNIAKLCTPPFPIIARIQQQIVKLCIKGAMSLDFKIRKVPFIILRNVKSFAMFPSVVMTFGGNAKKTLALTMVMATGSVSSASVSEQVSTSELGDEVAKGQALAAQAKSTAGQADAAQGDLKLSPEDKEEEAAGGADEDGEEDEDIGAYDLSDEALESKFLEIDVDNDGFITPVELERAIRESGSTLTDKEVKAMMNEADSDGDGSIDMAEFKAAMRFDPSTSA